MILEGIRIIDWGQWAQEPAAAYFLGDLGAEVIKVEERGKGDAIRRQKTRYGQSLIAGGDKEVEFELIGRNKKSLAIDLKKEEGKKIFYQLAKESDVLLTNFRQKAIDKLGLDYDTVSQYNQRLIYVSASAYGKEGPEKDAGLYDLLGVARSGAMMAAGEEGMVPIRIPISMADMISAVIMAYAALAALLMRERKGIGQHIDVSQFGSMIAILNWNIWLESLGVKIPRVTRSETQNPTYNYYRCKDGRWIVLGALELQHWLRLCKVPGLEALEKDSRFESAEKREANNKELIHVLDEFFASKMSKECEKLLREVDIPCSPINRFEDLFSDPQVIANKYIEDFDHPTLGKVKVPGVGLNIKFSKTPASIRMWAPELGQHNEEVLTEILGYSRDDIARLRAEEVI
ncbi:CaiB/BaiF CoA transferase family protein [Chloroflexota bacterium]